MTTVFTLCVWQTADIVHCDADHKRYWSREIKFEVPETLIAELSETMLETLINQGNYSVDSIFRITINPPKSDEMSDIIKATNAWRKIETILAESRYKTGPLTRMTLYAGLFKNKSFQSMAKDRIKKTLLH